jgi:hypothetical protein
VAPAAPTIRIGGTVSLSVLEGSGSIRWSSSATDVASVSAAGVVTGLRPGTAVIRVSRGGVAGGAVVTVAPPKLSTDVLTLHVAAGSKLQVSGGTGTTTWKSSRTSVATVSSTGVVRGLIGGTAVVTARRNGISMTCLVIVQKREYKMSISRGVSGGKGYVYVTAKTWDGHILKGRTVKFIRDAVVLGSARTNSKGVARLKVVKDGAALHLFEADVVADSKHNDVRAMKSLMFANKVAFLSGFGSISRKLHLSKAKYWVKVSGTGLITLKITPNVVPPSISGYNGYHGLLTIRGTGNFHVSGSSSVAGGFVEIEIDKLL